MARVDCPVNDPDCLGADGDCHDACERPVREEPKRPPTIVEKMFVGLLAIDASIVTEVMDLPLFLDWQQRSAHERRAKDPAWPFAVIDRANRKDDAKSLRVYGTSYCDGTVWSPSRSIDAAWAVIEHLRKGDSRGSFRVMIQDLGAQFSPGFQVRFAPFDADGNWIKLGPDWFGNDSAPTAIAIAALVAVRGRQ